MGAEASQPVKKAAATAIRTAGEPMNTLGWPAVHEQIFYAPTVKPHRYSICRCWKSAKFPLCDNAHQKLQKLGVNVGPTILEVKAAQNVGPTYFGSGSAGQGPTNLGGGMGGDVRMFAAGGFAAASLGGGAHMAGLV
mmetsp:Transcript_81988/g.171613  ORF Transcript_81988/g.171613 Transcript_81988/m.171613 type:complete len:137 (+) Transcript_81988:168-578(+)